MSSIDPALLRILEKDCASLGSSFSSAGPCRVLAQPSNRLLFAKLTTPVDQVVGEGQSLRAMKDALEQCPRGSESLVPAVHAAGVAADGKKAYLVTDYLDMNGRVGSRGQRLLGQRLANMHKFGGNDRNLFGFDVPTHCGATEQDNTWTEKWSDFWADRRIGEVIKRIAARSEDHELSTLEGQMREKVYPLLLEPLDGKISPAVLHGDLWSGNVGEDAASGEPVIFDPSSYYGHNEAELGIMHMFGGFTNDFFEAYHAVLPRCQPYYDERIKLYELYHHLNHALMFGGSYRGGAVSIMKSLVSFAEREVRRNDASARSEL
ncbi:uncharacterized protein PFL1_02221 [Pseudozyma flocculosa PF-1]|uniref:protein-ribulosamine 3-kinase n=1 Tax=Pseudozyma flocculosa TaxID=84751 RepID=A0A5C3FAM8_9BASI|nr:uncharacterized protein PFL1_02221 [Pseudozyma flocculosa PF-1]EPQ30104.1 hypothetical protein PFL1_02221 [Pseudozyma flocculosa PF-1]SPO41452.1 related to fructosamine-3-kinase [Pseudozyma flocculosa]